MTLAATSAVSFARRIESRRARPVSGSNAVLQTTSRDGSVCERSRMATRLPSGEIAGSPVYHDRRYTIAPVSAPTPIAARAASARSVTSTVNRP
jgi:hypothetical protein